MLGLGILDWALYLIQFLCNVVYSCIWRHKNANTGGANLNSHNCNSSRLKDYIYNPSSFKDYIYNPSKGSRIICNPSTLRRIINNVILQWEVVRLGWHDMGSQIGWHMYNCIHTNVRSLTIINLTLNLTIKNTKFRPKTLTLIH